MSRHPGYDADACQHEECRPPESPHPPPYTQGPEAALRWIAEAETNARRITRLVVDAPGKWRTWLELLAQYESNRASAWLYAYGDADQARAVQHAIRQRVGLLLGVDSADRHARYRRNPQRSTRYAWAELVEPHIGAVLDEMADQGDEAGRLALLPELREVAAAERGEQVASALDPFLPAMVVAGG